MSNIKSYIDNQLSNIKVSNKLSDAILNQTTNKKERKHDSFTVRKSIAFVAVICLLFTGSMTAFAATIPAFNDLIYTINPQLAQLLYPINKSEEDHGIKVEVLNAVNDNHNAIVYFTVQDTTEKNRVNDNLNLCDTCDIDGPCALNTQMLSYDEKTNTALFVMRGFGGEGMSNQMTTFQMTKIMSDQMTHDWYHTGIDMEGLIDLNAKSFPVAEYFYIGGSELLENDLFVLEPDVMNVSVGDGIAFVTISNIGFVDGKLHIQTKWETSFDNHGRLSLVDKNEVANDDENAMFYDSYYFRTEEDSANCGVDQFSKHIEYVFDVSSLEELSSYNLWGNFVEDGTFTEGKWNVNFRMSDSDKLYVSETKGIADCVEVTSIGAYINGYTGDCEDCELSIVMKNGMELTYSQFSTDDSVKNDENIWNISMMFVDAPIDLNEIVSISIDGSEIYTVK